MDPFFIFALTCSTGAPHLAIYLIKLDYITAKHVLMVICFICVCVL